MASKGQKFSKYSEKLKQEIMYKVKEEMSIRYLAKKYNIPSGTIFTWTDKKNHPEKYLGYGQKRGRKKNKRFN